MIHAAFSPDSRLVAVACGDHKASVFEVETGRQILPDLTHGAGVNSVQFSPDGRFILTAGLDFTARIWLTGNHQMLQPAGILGHSGRVMQAMFLPDGRHVVSCCDDGTVRLWNLAGEELLPAVNSCHFSGDGKVFLQSSNGVAQVKQSASGKAMAGWTNAVPDLSFALSHNGRFVASFEKWRAERPDRKTIVEVRDAMTGSMCGPGVASSNLAQVLVTDSGKTMVGVAEKCFLHRWDVPRGNSLGPPLRHREKIESAFISRDEKKIGAWSTNYVGVWDLASGRQLFAPICDGVLLDYANFSPDGSLLVVCDVGVRFAKCAARLFSAADGKPLPFAFNHDDGVLFASFSPDGRRIVTASEDFTARVWDAKTGVQLIPPLKHAHQVTSAVFSPDGNWILTASVDQSARVWSAETGEPLTPPLRHVSQLRSAAFVNDGHEVLTIAVDSHQWLWKLHVEQRSIPEISILAQVLSGSTVTRWGGLSSANTNSLRDNWLALQTTRPGDFAVSDSQTVAWHDFQARQSELTRNWSAAAFHLKQMLFVRPEDASFNARLIAAAVHLDAVPP